ncbi:hypothetical protein ACQP2P_16200 [Dactylosporangium sp. CA-139114]|uniref:hypothetical protein n=1 Tax=Dactylosporangium sp. CA-139114 TaxID=3239931 RepID=UPI003D99CCB3
MTAPRALDGLPCLECARPLLFDEANGWVVCATAQCVAMGMEMPLWRAARRRDAADPNPAGWPRPLLGGLPVPWITVVAAGRAWFRHLHGDRLRDCQTGWLCQVCGELLPELAWVVVTEEGHVVTPAGMHQRCRVLATSRCPHLQAAGRRLRDVEVTRERIISGGRPWAQVRSPVSWQDWTLLGDKLTLSTVNAHMVIHSPAARGCG